MEYYKFKDNYTALTRSNIGQFGGKPIKNYKAGEIISGVKKQTPVGHYPFDVGVYVGNEGGNDIWIDAWVLSKIDNPQNSSQSVFDKMFNTDKKPSQKQTGGSSGGSVSSGSGSGSSGSGSLGSGAESKKIIGLKPWIFYTIIGVVVVGIAVTSFLIFKGKKK